MTRLMCIVSIVMMTLAPAARAAEKPMNALSFKAKDITGKEVDLSSYKGKVVLIVNVASECGYTKQYKTLQQLHDKYADKGLAILGFPCNQFGGQEPGGEQQIKQFCESKFGVKFDLFSKIDVNGESAHPLYQYLTGNDVPVADRGKVKWNFEKFLVDRSGKVVARFRSGPDPMSSQVTAAVEAALAGK
jgi:glutathione peroxidase